MDIPKAIIVFSGGLDSTTVLAIAQSKGYEVHALTFDYQQRHHIEVENSKLVAKHMLVNNHTVLKIPLEQIGGSALTSNQIQIPKFKENSKEIPSTYVPARNTIFIAYALGLAESVNAQTIFLGASSVDYSGYPDCRPEYFKAYNNLAELACKSTVNGNSLKIETPLIDLSKAQTIKLGHSLGVDYSKTISCYQANHKGEACGICDSCAYRKKGFKEAGLEDPTIYFKN